MVPGVVLGVEVQPAADRGEVHLVQAKVGEDGQVAHREHLVQVLLVGNGDVKVVEHLLGQWVVQCRADVGQQHGDLVADHPYGYEEVVVDPGEPDRASD